MKRKLIAQLVSVLGVTSVATSVLAQSSTDPALRPALASTQAQQSVELSSVVEKAIMTHPEVRARFQDFTSSLEGQNVARGAWRPQINARAWAGREWRSNAPGTPSTDWSRPGWSLELRQMIFDGFGTFHSVSQLGFESLSRFYDLRATTESLANQAVAAYLDVQRYREMEVLARDNFDMHKTTLAQLRERQQAGVGRGVDLEQASGRLALAQSNLLTESNNLNDVIERYRRIVGEVPVSTLAPVPEVADKLPVPGVTPNFDNLLRQNPSVLSKQALVQSAEAGQKAAKAAYSPKLEFIASTGRDREQPTPQLRDLQSSSVQLLLTYNLYRGGADQARERQTAAQQYAARDVRDYTCRNVQQELAIAWNNIIRLREQIPFLREHELSTSKVRVAYQQQFQIGQRSLLDLLDTENELFQARRALANAQYDLKKAGYQLLSLSSKVLPTLGLAQPHAESRPQEQQELQLDDETLRVCRTEVPDTSNLAPVAAYRTGDQPSVLQARVQP